MSNHTELEYDMITDERTLLVSIRIWHDGINLESSEVHADIEEYLQAEMRDEFNIVAGGQPCLVELLNVEMTD